MAAPAAPCSSIDVDGPRRRRGFVAEDPFAKAGLFESTVIRGFRTVFKDGDLV